MLAIDLFCGAGGLSLGLVNAGFKIALAIDKDKYAVETYKTNHNSMPNYCILADLGELDPLQTLAKIKIKSNDISLIAGGPPCQGFSMANGHSRSINNPKNKYVWDFVRWIELIRPEAFLMENVKGFEQIDGGILISKLKEKFIALGYKNTIHITLDAVEYGVPQRRKRVFLIGFLNGSQFEKPKVKLDGIKRHFIPVKDAIIGDLPEINELPGSNASYYKNGPVTKYQKKIRQGKKILHNHITTVCRGYIVEKFSWIKQGENWQAIKDRIGIKVQYSSLYKRLDENHPSITMSNYRKSMIIHPNENRLLSVREAARLQSFPDNYIFKGGISSMQQQVGDAVPPLLAKSVAEKIVTLI
ncbi:MAG: DNA cytosine methyltransferase [Bacteroidota bacterium]|nr:DNA cytosine methyltransferase [Bacteroidota bacterium]